MLRKNLMIWVLTAAMGLSNATAWGAHHLRASLHEGKVELTSIGSLAFGPEGIIFVSDPIAATIYAVDTAERRAGSGPAPLEVKGIDAKVAALLGTSPDKILIHDLAVNPISGRAYLSVSRGRGPEGSPVLVRVGRRGRVRQVELDKVSFSKAAIPNPAKPGQGQRNPRLQSITDLAFVDGKIIVAGLSNEEFASNLRSIPFPFGKVDNGTSIEIYHAAHGRYETRSPVRTFTNYLIGDEAYLLAAYTCTPLVRIPMNQLQKDKKIVGTTIADLGNHNRPLDMFVYHKGEKDYILMSNSSRGMMKITTEEIGTIEALTERVSEPAGLPYETIEGLNEVLQLDRLGKEHALMLVKGEGDSLDLTSLELP